MYIFRKPPDLLVATPGRLNDHLQNSGLQGLMQGLRVLIFDEADQLLDMGFRPAIVASVSYVCVMFVLYIYMLLLFPQKMLSRLPPKRRDRHLCVMLMIIIYYCYRNCCPGCFQKRQDRHLCVRIIII
jgi:hypothetical protein